MPVFSTNARISSSACAYAAPLPSRISGRLALFSTSSARLHRFRRRNLARRRVDDLDQRLLSPSTASMVCDSSLAGEIEIDAAGTARHGGADRTRDADADVVGVQHAKRCLAERLGDCELIHLLVVALLQIDDLALAASR